MRAPSTPATAGFLERVKLQPDLVFGAGLVLILLVLLVPLPSRLIDALLTLNITLSLLVLLTSACVSRPLEFSVFPSLLLVATLFRLSLNIATTRLILGNAAEGSYAAGRVVETFGGLVGGDNLVIGLVIFTVLVVVQFVVITRGSTRVSEVAARFQLDAMPGKQLSIDGDLAAGLIDQQGAGERRQQVAREADFYGAMDGASKFVRGDAIAGLFIMLVNLVGGVAVGLLDHDMRFGQAFGVFGRLTIGDGLVSQIPALMVSVAAALLVTRSAASEALGRDLGRQVLANERVLYTAAVFLWLLLPAGMPPPAILLTSLACIACGYLLRRERHGSEGKETSASESGTERERSRLEVDARSLARVETLELEVGYRLLPLLDAERGGDLLVRMAAMREKLARELGLVVPPVRVADSREIRAREYSIKLRGCRLGTWKAAARGFLARCAPAYAREGAPPGGLEPLSSFELGGARAFWIETEAAPAGLAHGFELFGAAHGMTLHLEELIREHAAEILTREEVSRMVRDLAERSPALVAELVPDHVTIGDLQRVLQDLLREGVSIRDIEAILECLGACSGKDLKYPRVLEEVRLSLARPLVAPLAGRDGKLHVVLLDPPLEEALLESFERTRGNESLGLDPGTLDRVRERTETELQGVRARGWRPCVLCARPLRRHFWKLMGARPGRATVLSYEEVLEDMDFEVHATVRLASLALPSTATEESMA